MGNVIGRLGIITKHKQLTDANLAEIRDSVTEWESRVASTAIRGAVSDIVERLLAVVMQHPNEMVVVWPPKAFGTPPLESPPSQHYLERFSSGAVGDRGKYVALSFTGMGVELTSFSSAKYGMNDDQPLTISFELKWATPVTEAAGEYHLIYVSVSSNGAVAARARIDDAVDIAVETAAAWLKEFDFEPSGPYHADFGFSPPPFEMKEEKEEKVAEHAHYRLTEPQMLELHAKLTDLDKAIEHTDAPRGSVLPFVDRLLGPVVTQPNSLLMVQPPREITPVPLAVFLRRFYTERMHGAGMNYILDFSGDGVYLKMQLMWDPPLAIQFQLEWSVNGKASIIHILSARNKIKAKVAENSWSLLKTDLGEVLDLLQRFEISSDASPPPSAVPGRVDIGEIERELNIHAQELENFARDVPSLVGKFHELVVNLTHIATTVSDPQTVASGHSLPVEIRFPRLRGFPSSSKFYLSAVQMHDAEHRDAQSVTFTFLAVENYDRSSLTIVFTRSMVSLKSPSATNLLAVTYMEHDKPPTGISIKYEKDPNRPKPDVTVLIPDAMYGYEWMFADALSQLRFQVLGFGYRVPLHARPLPVPRIPDPETILGRRRREPSEIDDIRRRRSPAPPVPLRISGARRAELFDLARQPLSPPLPPINESDEEEEDED